LVENKTQKQEIFWGDDLLETIHSAILTWVQLGGYELVQAQRDCKTARGAPSLVENCPYDNILSELLKFEVLKSATNSL